MISIAPRPAPGPTTIDPKKPVSMNVDYDTPVIVKTHLGGVPNDFFDNNALPGPTVKCTDGRCAMLPNAVYANNPLLNNDGTPAMHKSRRHLEDAPVSPANSMALWGTVGAATAGTLGLLGGALISQPVLGCAIGTTLGLVLGGGVAGWMASGDRIRLVWDKHTITNTTMLGYKDSVKPAEKDGQKGYMHHYTPVLKTVKVGEYQVPRIEHYKD